MSRQGRTEFLSPVRETLFQRDVMKFTKLLIAMSLFLGAAGMLTGCSDDDDDDDGLPGGGNPANVYDAAAGLADYSSLVAAIDKAGLASTLQSASANYTVFAPDNDAFAALLTAIGASSLDDVTAEQLTPILLYHVLGTTVDAAAATAAATAGDQVTGLGGTLQLGLDGSSIQIDGSAIVEAADAVVTDNGIIHGIDAVLLPSIADVVVSDASFSNLATALTVADGDASAPNYVGTLDDDAGDFTVFAPTDAAFGALVGALSAGSTGISGLGDFASYQLIPVLNYHVIAGTRVLSTQVSDGEITTLGGTPAASTSGGVSIDGANVVTADLLTSNGVIHVIDAVLVPSITDMVTTLPEFTQLFATVGAADGAAGTTPKVAETLDAAGTFTLFAPSNTAFGNLGSAPSGQDLTNVLLYHVLAEAAPIYAADALGLGSPTAFGTALGSDANSQLTVSGGSGVTIADAGTTTAADVEVVNYFASNGVIHVVDKVLIPGS